MTAPRHFLIVAAVSVLVLLGAILVATIAPDAPPSCTEGSILTLTTDCRVP
jgi:hypothetical protein